MANEEQLELAPDDYDDDAWHDGPVLYDATLFQSREHARWAYVWNRFGIKYLYQPKHFGLTIDVGIKPTFQLENPGCFVHCVARQPSKATQFACHYLAQDTCISTYIAVGEIRPPSHALGPMDILWTAGGDHLRPRTIGALFDRLCFCRRNDPKANHSGLVNIVKRAQESFIAPRRPGEWVYQTSASESCSDDEKTAAKRSPY